LGRLARRPYLAPTIRSTSRHYLATSDLNFTAAVALMVVVLVEALEIRTLGVPRYLKGPVIPNPLRWLETLVRPLSLAFRLFGSVFAGHVLMSAMLAIAPVVLCPS
jgi:F0F1-type ATP synthase membrane subunit a